MNDIKTVGIDLAKSVFYIHGVDSRGKTVIQKKLSRAKVLPFFSNLKPCLVGMEAGGGSHNWAREIQALGHEAKLMAPQYVKPYVKTNKTDSNDAEAICEAVTRPSMRFVHVKTADQQDVQCIHRIRSRLVGNRSALSCEIRGFLGEYGIVVPVGIRQLLRALPEILADEKNNLTSLTRQLIQELSEEMIEIKTRIQAQDRRIYRLVRHHPIAKRLATIPGVGPLAATAIAVTTPDPKLFKNGREFAAYLGLVPKQRSSGGKQKILGISKRGDKYIRTMLIHGARVCVSYNDKMQRSEKTRIWVQKMRERRGYCKTTVAVANKNARICWALMNKGEDFKLVA